MGKSPQLRTTALGTFYKILHIAIVRIGISSSSYWNKTKKLIHVKFKSAFAQFYLRLE